MELLPYEAVTDKIKQKRMQLGLNQNEVANAAGVDRATVNRMEAHDVERTAYKTVYKVWEALREAEQRQIDAETAADLMNERITWVSTDDTGRDARRLMWDNAYSQLPVRDPESKASVGSITEQILMMTDEYSHSVKELMGPAFIEVRPSTSREILVGLFQDDEDALLVTDAETGDYRGIVTPSDTF